MNYINRLKEITSNFIIWIDGSFSTNKTNPNDLDAVIFIDNDIYEQNIVALKENFTAKTLLKTLSLDIYLVVKYKESHENYIFYHSDKLYWLHQFGKTKVNRFGKQFDKGIIQIKMGKYE